MSVLITGGTGFVGAYTARQLLQHDHRVVTLDNRPSNVLHQVLRANEYERVSVLQGDVSSLGDLGHAIRDHGVDRVIHLASLLHPAADERPDAAVQVNIKGQGTVLEAARLFDLAKVVWASSAVVFGSRSSHERLPLPNDATHRPVNLYGATKSFDEFLSRHYALKWRIDVLGLRFTLIYGPGRVRGASSFINELTRPALGETANVPFADDVVDWQYVEDVAKLLAKCINIPRTRNTVFNTQFDKRSVREAGDYVSRAIPSAEIHYEPGEFGVAWELDDSFLQEEIGFQPSFAMEDGLQNLLNQAGQEAVFDAGIGPPP